MPSAIESAAYGEWADHVSADGHVGEHCLVEFAVRRSPAADGSDIVVLGVTPENREFSAPTLLTFTAAHVGRILQTDDNPEFHFLPWSIVGFYCTDVGADRWSFQLNCEGIRIQWSSAWPQIARGESQG